MLKSCRRMRMFLFFWNWMLVALASVALSFQPSPRWTAQMASFGAASVERTRSSNARWRLVHATHAPVRGTTTCCTSNPTVDESDHTAKVVVVGAGVGGLAVAARLASHYRNGGNSCHKCEVMLLEKNQEVGGRCGSFICDVPELGAFRHERGPSLLLLPDVYRSVFHDCTDRQAGAEDFGLSMLQCAPAYQVVFEDGDRIDVGFPRDIEKSSSEGRGHHDDATTLLSLEQCSRAKMDQYEMEGASKWDDYMQACQAFLDCGLPNFIEQRLDLLSFPTFVIEALKNNARAWPLKPHSDVLDAIFESSKMKALASFQDLYVGLEPYKNDHSFGGGIFKTTAPAVFGLLAAIELHPTNKKCGVFAPVGGFDVVSKSLEALCEETGVTIQCGRTVRRVTNDGVYVTKSLGNENEADGPASCTDEFIQADLVVVNADLPYAKKVLEIDGNADAADGDAADAKAPRTLRNDETPGGADVFDWDDSFVFSSGVIAFHWSIGQRCDDLNTHNVFLIGENDAAAEQSWETLRSNSGGITDDQSLFNFYVHRASKTDPTAAPDGCDSVMVLVPCRTLLRDEQCANLPKAEAIELYKQQFTESMIETVRSAVFHRMGKIESLQDLEEHIVDEVVDTPVTWADQFNLAAGTPFALSHGFNQLSLTRPGCKSSRNDNVLYCGASSRPGNGVPLVLIGAKQVASQAIQHLDAAIAEKEAIADQHKQQQR